MDENQKLAKSLSELSFAVDALLHKKIDLRANNDDLSNYDARIREYHKINYYSALRKFELSLNSDFALLAENERIIKEIKKSIPPKDLIDNSRIRECVNDISHYVSKLKFPTPLFKINLNAPEEIQEEMMADITELNKSFDSKCFRSSVILCGRLLETALHRKYFEATNLDILEKNPGIGLGKLIAKLSEKNVEFDPGLTQQIHLINQVRISSVHKKQKPFYPTEDQARAIILFTLDTLKKLF